jgi:hypothetical protein
MRKNIVKLSWMRYSPSCTSPFLGFILNFPDRDQLFKKKGKMHVAVAYTKGEIEQAQKVQELLCTSGYPSYQDIQAIIYMGTHPNLYKEG